MMSQEPPLAGHPLLILDMAGCGLNPVLCWTVLCPVAIQLSTPGPDFSVMGIWHAPPPGPPFPCGFELSSFVF